jgi:hypothetical protein
VIYGSLQLLGSLVINIIWLFFMITSILCGLFLCGSNLTLFPLCQIFSLMSQHSLIVPSKLSSATMVEGLHTATYMLNGLPSKAINATSPYVALHGVAPSYEHLCVFDCACYPNLSTKTAHKLASRSTKCIFLRYSIYHKGYRCLDLTANNIVIFRYVFDEVDFPFSVSPHLTNDLDIFLHNDSPNAAPMRAPLPTPRVPLWFPLLAAVGGQTAPRTEVGG